LREKLPGTQTQDAGQGIIDLIRLTKPDNAAILFHGVSLSLRGSGRLDTRLDTPPISYRHHPVSRLAPRSRRQGDRIAMVFVAVHESAFYVVMHLLKGHVG
jgi:hypothetical protein